MLRKYHIIFYFVLLVSLSSIAQEKEIALDPVTITSSLNSVTASKTGRNIIVIKAMNF
jgi:hypothetical protein